MKPLSRYTSAVTKMNNYLVPIRDQMIQDDDSLIQIIVQTSDCLKKDNESKIQPIMDWDTKAPAKNDGLTLYNNEKSLHVRKWRNSVQMRNNINDDSECLAMMIQT